MNLSSLKKEMLYIILSFYFILLFNFFIFTSKSISFSILLACIIYNNKVIIYKYFYLIYLLTYKLLYSYKVLK